MVCAFDSLVEERDKEKADKYKELAADMAIQQAGYRVRVVPIVIGDLGSIDGLSKLPHTINIFQPLLTKRSLERHAVKGALFKHQDAYWIK